MGTTHPCEVPLAHYCVRLKYAGSTSLAYWTESEICTSSSRAVLCYACEVHRPACLNEARGCVHFVMISLFTLGPVQYIANCASDPPEQCADPSLNLLRRCQIQCAPMPAISRILTLFQQAARSASRIGSFVLQYCCFPPWLDVTAV